eukprot:947643_1
MNLTKRISQHDRGSSEKQIASALPASFTKYQGIKKSYSHEHKDEKAAAEAQFVPPPPPPSMGPYGKSNQSDGMAYVDSDGTDDDETHYVGYLTGPSHVVLMSMDSNDNALKKHFKPRPPRNQHQHTRGRSNSVPLVSPFLLFILIRPQTP